MQNNKKYDILIVDDDKHGIKVLTKILQNEGYNVRIASNGELAIKSILSKIPEIILMDVQMPVMDGFTACYEIKKNSKFKDIPIIFITSMDVDFNKVKAFELGAVDYITKPYSLAEVKARVKTHMDLSIALNKLDYQNKNLEKIIEEKTKKLVQTMKEKQVLLQEINHRVNNNLQILLSLLNMQQKHFPFDNVEDLINNFYGHVSVIAKINQILYKSESFIEIDFVNFLKHLKEIVLTPSSIKKLNYVFEDKEFRIDVNHAIPLGHIIKELISHCIKYNDAIETDRKITIKLNLSDKELYEIIISDNSGGAEKIIDYGSQKDSNMVLLCVFLKELNADFKYSFENDTLFTISFNKMELNTYHDITANVESFYSTI